MLIIEGGILRETLTRVMGVESKNRNGKSKNGRNLEYWNCGKTGHLKKNYRAPRKNKDKNNDVANAVTDEVRDALILSVDDSYDSWVLDLDASFHTTSQCDVLENYVAGNHGKVYLDDGEPLDIIGMRDVNLKMSNGSVWKIQKVRHVLGLIRNLVSVGQLDDEGHNVVFNNGSWKVTKGAMVVTRGKKTRTLYVNSNCRSTIADTDDSVTSDLWHYKLGHMSEKGMKMLHSDGKLQGLKEVYHNLCEG